MPQQKFASDAGVSQRTLQRAEQSKDVGAQHISAIAKLLEVPTEQLVKATGDHKGANAQQDGQKDIIRLDPVRGRWIMERLQPYGPDEIEYNFDIDPNSEMSELIASVIEFCDQHNLDDRRNSLEPADKIRAIGLLNDKLDALRLRQIGVFASAHYIWQAEPNEIEGTKTNVWIPNIVKRLLVAFGSAERDFMTEFDQDFYKKKPIYDFCIDYNLKDNIDPEIVRIHARKLFDDDFTPLYRQCWDAHRATVADNTKVIALVPQK
jgi:transcriptional regulator with XRE-family HTH domain